MSTQPALPSPVAPRSRPDAARRQVARMRIFVDDEPILTRRSVLVGVIGTIIFHLLFGYGMQHGFRTGSLEQAQDQGTELDLQLQPDEQEEAPPAQPRFVETNPESPENIPDKTDNFAARNSQAANPDPVDQLSPDRTPAREGEDNPEFDRMISGQLQPEVVAAPAPPSQEAQPQPETEAPMRRDPLAGFEKEESENEEGTGSAVADASDNPTPAAEKVEGEDEKSDSTQPRMVAVEASPAQRPAPQPRPRLPRVTPGPVRQQLLGVSQTGQVSPDAKFSQYGAYMDRLVEAVSERWDSLCSSRSYAETSTRVILRFRITRAGMIRELQTVDSTASAFGVLLCRSAIEDGQSYGEWTEDMVATLGSEQTVVLRFYYR